jgi:hypothetical protein
MILKRVNMLMVESFHQKQRKKFRRWLIKSTISPTSIFYFTLRNTYLNKLHLKIIRKKRIENSFTDSMIEQWTLSLKESLSWHSHKECC